VDLGYGVKASSKHVFVIYFILVKNGLHLTFIRSKGITWNFIHLQLIPKLFLNLLFYLLGGLLLFEVSAPFDDLPCR